MFLIYSPLTEKYRNKAKKRICFQMLPKVPNALDDHLQRVKLMSLQPLHASKVLAIRMMFCSSHPVTPTKKWNLPKTKAPKSPPPRLLDSKQP